MSCPARTGDFDRFFYLLAYDADRVSEAIGERFGSDKTAGSHFLEKIVQVPLNLPEIRTDDLTRFFFESLSDLLNANKIDIVNDEFRRFEEIFISAFEINIDSPRKVIRYLNALQFSLPLMKGELNVVDLMLLEYLKIFHKQHFDFVKHNPKLLISLHQDPRDLKKQLDEEYALIENGASGPKLDAAKGILIELFPFLKLIWNNVVQHPDNIRQLAINKRIASSDYFQRYFTFSIADTEISDIAFQVLIDKLAEVPSNKISELLIDFAPEGNLGILIQKLRTHEKEFTESQSLNIAKGICIVADKLKKEPSLFATIPSSFTQGAMLVVNLIKNINKDNLRRDAVFALFNSITTIAFANEFVRWVSSTSNSIQLVSTGDLALLRKELLERCLKESDSKPFYLVFPDEALDMLLNWSQIDKDGLNLYLRREIVYVKDVQEFLRSIVGKTYVTTLDNPLNRIRSAKNTIGNMSDFSEGLFKILSESIGTDWIYDIIKGSSLIATDVIIETRYSQNQTLENLLGQFAFWHKKGNGIQWEIENLKKQLEILPGTGLKLTSEVSREIIRNSIIPLLKELEHTCFQYNNLFESLDRDIKLTIQGTSIVVANNSHNWETVESNLLTEINKRRDRLIQMLDYELSLKGFQKSVTHRYMRVDVKIQFNEYSYLLIFNSDYQNQNTLAYDNPISEAAIQRFIKIVITKLNEDMRVATDKKK